MPVRRRTKKAPRRKNRKMKTRRPGVLKDKSMEASNMKGTIVDISRFNVGPINRTRRTTFRYASYFTIGFAGGNNINSNTLYWSAMSPYQPEVSGQGLNGAATYWTDLMGTAVNQYAYYHVDYVDVSIRVIGDEESIGKFPMVCVGVSPTGSGDYAATQSISSIAVRPFTMSKTLEYLGDTTWRTFTFRIYPNKILGISRRQYKDDAQYRFLWNQDNTKPPFIAISLGDAMSDLNQMQGQDVKGECKIDYHCSLYQTALKTST